MKEANCVMLLLFVLIMVVVLMNLDLFKVRSIIRSSYDSEGFLSFGRSSCEGFENKKMRRESSS